MCGCVCAHTCVCVQFALCSLREAFVFIENTNGLTVEQHTSLFFLGTYIFLSHLHIDFLPNAVPKVAAYVPWELLRN